MLIEDTYDPRDPRTRDRNQYGFFVAICLICCVCIGLVVLVVFLVAATNNGNGNGNGEQAFTCPGFTDLSESQQSIVSDCSAGLEGAGVCVFNLPDSAFGTCRVEQFTGGTSTAPTLVSQNCRLPIDDCVEGCTCLGQEVRVCTRDIDQEEFPGDTVFQCVATGPAPTPPPNALRCGAFSASSVVAQEETATCNDVLLTTGICNNAARCVPSFFGNNSAFPGTPGGIVLGVALPALACVSTDCTVATDQFFPCTCQLAVGTTCEVTAIGLTGGELTTNFLCLSSTGVASIPSSAIAPLDKAALAVLLDSQ